MEAVPRMCMLSLELKWSLEKVEFGPILKQYIQNHYMEDANKYNDEIKQIDQLRVNATNVTRDFNGISTLKKYYGQLHLLTSRFPVTDGGEAAPVFTWIDTFHEEPFSHADATFDQACILYNLGVLHSILGAKESRGTEEEMKVACTHFQCAAGAFGYLKDHFQSYMSPDISFDLMTIYINLMLGQAQECLLEKSMQDNRKSSLVSRISMQVIDYYRLALRGLEDSNISSLMGSRRSKTWKKTLQVKISHFLSVAYTYMSNQAFEQQKHGERVCWLQQASDRHNEAMKMSKGVHDTILQALNFTKDVVVGKFQAAKKDNEFVYHEAVPVFENIPEIKGASLVKALSFQPYDESISGPDIFKKLVPMEAHEASSLYSEEKAKLLRRIGDDMEQKTKHLEQFMASLQLDQLKLNASEEPERLPQALLEVCAALSVKNDPIKKLVSCMQELSNVVLDVDCDVKETQELLDEEDKQDADFQKQFGKQPSSSKVMTEIQHEFGKYKEGHSKASKSNEELHKAMEVHIGNIRVLAGPLEEIQAALPSLKNSITPEDKEAESKLIMLLNKVEEMKNQRVTLEAQLREQLRKDDITSRIVTTEGANLKEMFGDELQKHNDHVTYIEQNLAAQENILKALTEANAAYADTRKMTAELTKKRGDRIDELITSCTVYDDLLAKSHKGIDFYKKLQIGVQKLLQRTQAVVQKNQEERINKMERLKPKPVPTRPTAPKPLSAVDPTPAGPRLSDFWKPKSAKAGVGDIPPSAMMSGPGSLERHSSFGGAPTAAVPPQGVARHSSFDSAPSSLGNQGLPGQPARFGQLGGDSVQPGGYDQSRMHSVSPSAPMQQPGGLSQPQQPMMSQPSSLSQQQPMMSQPGSHSQQQPMMSQQQQPMMSQPGIQSQQQQPMMSQPGNQLQQQPSQTPMASQPDVQQRIISQQSQQPVMPNSRPQMPPPMVPQTVNQPQAQQSNPNLYHPQLMQAMHSQQQQQQTYTEASSNSHQNIPQPSVPPSINASSTLQPHSSFQTIGMQAQPHASTAMVSSITAPISSPITKIQGHQVPQQGHQVPPQGHQVPPPQGHQVAPPQSHQVAPQHQVPPQGHQVPLQGHQVPPQGHQVPPQGHQVPPQVHQVPPQGHQVPPQGHQVPTQGQQVPPPQGHQVPPQGHQVPQQGNQAPPPQGHQVPPQGHQVPQQGNQAPPPQGHQVPPQGHQVPQQGHQVPQPQGHQVPPQGHQVPSQVHQQQFGTSQPVPRSQPPEIPQANTYSQQPNIPPQGSPSHLPYMVQQPQQPIQPSGQPQPRHPMGPQQHTSGPINFQQGGVPQPSMPRFQNQPPNPQVNRTPTASPQHRPVQAYPQPGAPGQPSPHQVGQPQYGQVKPNQQTPTASPQHRPTQPGQSFTQGSQQPGFRQAVPQHQTHHQQQPFNQARYETPSSQGSPVRQTPQNVPQGQAQQGSYMQGQPQHQAFPGQAHPPRNQLATYNTGGMQPVNMGQQAGYAGQPPNSAGQSGQQSTMGQPPRMVQPPPPQGQLYHQAGGQAWPQTQPGSIPQQPNSNQQQQPASSGHPLQQPYIPQSQPQQGSQFPAGPANQLPPQRFSQTNQAMPQPGMNQSSQRITPAGGPPNQPFQQTSQPPLNQVQQVNKALKEEQGRLPQPSLQPVKIEPSACDLLSTSPDNEQKSLGQPLVPETQPSDTASEEGDLSETQPAAQPQSASEAALSGIFIQSGTPGDPGKPSDSPDAISRSAVTPPISKPATPEGYSVATRPFPKIKDPYDDKPTLEKFIEEVERFEKHVDGLGKQMLSGPIVLDGLWKELTEAQDRDTRQYSIAVARCYSTKNRYPDSMPYDHNRVKLHTGKDDYINASFINDLSPASPPFIATQAPLPTTYNDFWLMVYEQQVSLIAMLVSQAPTAKSKAEFNQYWPEDRGQVKTYGSMLISMQSQRSTDYHTERTFHLIHKETRQERTVFQLQFTSWPEFGVPNKPTDVLQFISEVNSYYKQQRSPSTPIVVHCNSGVGRTGSFCLIYSAVQEIMCAGGVVDIPRQVKTLRQQRRGMVAEKEQLKFSYIAVMCFAQQVLSKRGISTKPSMTSPHVDQKHPQRLTSFDAIMGVDSVTSLQTRISKMSVRSVSLESVPAVEAISQDDLINPGSLSPVGDEEVLPHGGDEADGDPALEVFNNMTSPPTTQTDTTNGLNLNLSDTEQTSSNVAMVTQAPPSLVEFTKSNLTDFSVNAQHFIPDVVESSQQEGGEPNQGSESTDGSLPSILADLTPQNFSIKGMSKQRVSKADFYSKKSSIGAGSSEADPLSSLDPLWTIKNKEDTESAP
ncbi:tyrosine-protein phosphatase non-receptor type 23-like isoform X2 [Asterias amurensis]|uniref:tyrosine-protein phosphatase non-receptor type 23-like isoform X2 n=1 Tax=Asterias amurensis TaxID=7602 RepID=UPI003AB2097F